MKIIKFEKDILILLKYLPISLAMMFGLFFFFIVFSRISYPYSLEWMEGGHLIQVDRLLSQQSLYEAPSIDYVPMIYPPLFFYFSAGLSSLLGFGFLPLRLISIVATIGCLLIIFCMVYCETRNSYSAVISSGFFLATYQLCYTWFDLARVDMLYIFLLLLGIYILRFSTKSLALFFAGIIFTSSILTKQTAIFYILPIIIYFSLINPIKKTLWLIGSLSTSLLLSLIILNLINDGWLVYFLFLLPSNHSISLNSFIRFWTYDLILPFGIALSYGLFFLLNLSKTSKNHYEAFYLVLLIGFLTASSFSRSNFGGSENTLIPVYVIVSIIFGLGMDRAIKLIPIIPKNFLFQFKILIYFVCSMQFITMLYNPLTFIPTKENQIANEKVIQLIEESNGAVLFPSNNYLNLFAGKKPYFNTVAFYEMRGHFGGNLLPEGKTITDQMDKSIQNKEFDLMILDLSDYYVNYDNLSNYYSKIRLENLENKNIFFTVYDEKSNFYFSFFKPID